MLKSLSLVNVGPASQMDMSFDSRMNLFTGDNGLGKSFVLESCWWALTDSWTDKPIRPRSTKGSDSQIKFTLGEENFGREIHHHYDPSLAKWKKASRASVKDDSLVIFSKVDGGYSIAFPREGKRKRKIVKLKPDEVWNGKTSTTGSICEGLIRDVVGWQQRDEREFDVIASVAKELSPGTETLRFAQSERVYPNDTRHYPMLEAQSLLLFCRLRLQVVSTLLLESHHLPLTNSRSSYISSVPQAGPLDSLLTVPLSRSLLQ